MGNQALGFAWLWLRPGSETKKSLGAEEGGREATRERERDRQPRHALVPAAASRQDLKLLPCRAPQQNHTPPPPPSERYQATPHGPSCVSTDISPSSTRIAAFKKRAPACLGFISPSVPGTCRCLVQRRLAKALVAGFASRLPRITQKRVRSRNRNRGQATKTQEGS